jgi:hypothetical protein
LHQIDSLPCTNSIARPTSNRDISSEAPQSADLKDLPRYDPTPVTRPCNAATHRMAAQTPSDLPWRICREALKHKGCELKKLPLGFALGWVRERCMVHDCEDLPRSRWICPHPPCPALPQAVEGAINLGGRGIFFRQRRQQQSRVLDCLYGASVRHWDSSEEPRSAVGGCGATPFFRDTPIERPSTACGRGDGAEGKSAQNRVSGAVSLCSDATVLSSDTAPSAGTAATTVNKLQCTGTFPQCWFAKTAQKQSPDAEQR